jgi:hypothetical protein
LTIPFFNKFSRVLLIKNWKIETRYCFTKICFQLFTSKLI